MKIMMTVRFYTGHGPILSRIHKKSLRGFYLKTSLFIQRKLKELYELGEENFLRKLKLENEDFAFLF